MADKVTAANKKIAKAASRDTAKKMATARKLASGPVGAKMIEMMDVPSFARGLTPQILIDLAKDKGIITPEQQADFKKETREQRKKRMFAELKGNAKGGIVKKYKGGLMVKPKAAKRGY